MALHHLMTTEDGSPTLSTTYDNGVCERMHHFRGALSESLYIYEPALEHILAQDLPTFHVMSLGLGLGYNELITAAVACRYQVASKTCLTTYEIDEELKAHFLNWLYQRPNPWHETFEQINSSLSKHYGLPTETLSQTLRQWHESQQWQLQGAFPDKLNPTDLYHVILYDAFSRKMDELLWQENFLNEFLKSHITRPTAFATYASTGNLKRALKKNGFELQKKSGFGGKKESTLAFTALR